MALVITLFVSLGTVTAIEVASPPVAAAAPKGMFAKNCIIKAPSGKGVKGNGCNLYGAPYYIGGPRIPNAGASKFFKSCGEGIMMGVIGLFWGPAGLAKEVFMGCAGNLVAARVFGS
ncbi:hypothetical protein ASE48_10135 [Mycobacterium sp. Root265]|nr:hypothetical protein ASE48_10135 [Mycobacterium sp. Root265]